MSKQIREEVDEILSGLFITFYGDNDYDIDTAEAKQAILNLLERQDRESRILETEYWIDQITALEAKGYTWEDTMLSKIEFEARLAALKSAQEKQEYE